MPNLGRNEKDLIIAIVTSVLAQDDPAELEVYSVTADDVVSQFDSGGPSTDADFDVFFGGLDLSTGEILTSILVLVAKELVQQGITVTREQIRAYLENRRRAEKERAAAVEAREKILAYLRSGQPD
ncbi:MAG: hypothetical protein M3P06_05365 [Acidobacteriota bacterium]|nr:hypothetical protein [Acidobacteriota bacterium]